MRAENKRTRETCEEETEKKEKGREKLLFN